MDSATRTVHPLFVKLFLETDADDLVEMPRGARRAKRARLARLVGTAARCREYRPQS